MSFVSRCDEFHAHAAQLTGLDDFGPDDYREPMRRLLADYDRYPRFNEIGAQLTAGEVVGKLAGRLLAQAGFKAHPDFADAPVERPIIIIGMPRTGTTALHRLITQDPGTQGLEMWLAAMPMPRPPRETWAAHPVFRQVAESIGQLYAMSPDLRAMHPVDADQPDECRFALDQTFWSTGSACTASAPDYGQWCLATDARYAYRRYRQILGLVASGDRRRWVLKNPDHIFALDAMLDVFPEACIVQTHREPIVSLTSVASMSYEVLRTREPHKTRLQHGRDMGFWMQALEQAECVRQKCDPTSFFDLHVAQFQADPVGSVERIYRYFQLPVSETAQLAWTARSTDDPRAGHGAHHYRPEDFGVSAAAFSRAAPTYCARYARLAQSG